jgi:hypothetical protein
VFFVNTNPAQFPHLVDLGRFNSSTTDPSAASNIQVTTSSGTITAKLPFNAVSGQTQATQVTPNGNLLADKSSAILTSAIASAVIGSNTNAYPIVIPNGFLRITNVADGAYTNSNPIIPNPPTGAGADQGIFNYEMFTGAGGFGGVNSYASSSAGTPTIPGQSNGYVFGTDNSTPEFPTGTPSTNMNVAGQIAEWHAYANSAGNANILADNAAQTAYTSAYNAWVTGGSIGPAPTAPTNQFTDSLGKDGTLDPTYGLYGNGGTAVPGASSSSINSASPGGTWTYNHYQGNAWTPNDNAQVVGTVTSAPGFSLAGPGAATPAAMSDMYAAANGGSTDCNTLMFQSGSEPAYCDAAVKYFAYNYNRYPPAGSAVTGEGTSGPGGLTDLEYVKGEVIQAYEAMDGCGGYQPGWQASISPPPEAAAFAGTYWQASPTQASGTKVYTRPRWNFDTAQTGNYVNYATANNPGDGIQFGNQANMVEWNSSNASVTTTSGTSGPQTPARYIQWFNAVGYDHLMGSTSSAIPNVCPGGGMDLTNSSPLWTQPSAVQYQLLKRCQQIDPTCTQATLYTGTGSGLLETVTLDLGESAFLYLDRTSNKLTICKSTAAPAYTASWNWTTQIPDGNKNPNLCYDNAWDPTTNSLAVNSIATDPGCSNCVPGSGDHNLHEQPFTQLSGSLVTFDGVQWNPGSGANGGLLGEMLLQNVTQAQGTAAGSGITFSGPN